MRPTTASGGEATIAPAIKYTVRRLHDGYTTERARPRKNKASREEATSQRALRVATTRQVVTKPRLQKPRQAEDRQRMDERSKPRGSLHIHTGNSFLARPSRGACLELRFRLTVCCSRSSAFPSASSRSRKASPDKSARGQQDTKNRRSTKAATKWSYYHTNDNPPTKTIYK